MSGICANGSPPNRVRRRRPCAVWIRASRPAREMIGTRHHVPTDANGPMECHELMALSFASHLFQSLAQVPTYSAWLVADADLTSALAYERRVLKLLAWGEPTRPWRLKCPLARALA